MEQLNWGIIGCGEVTEKKSGPAFQKVPGSALVAVMRRNAEKAEDYAKRHQVPRWYTDADALINDPEVNAIYIATPPLQHEAYALKVIKAGKPVYIEKPVTVNTAAAKRIEDAAAKANVKVSVAHYRRRQPVFLKVKELLDHGAIGDVRLVNMNMLQPKNSKLISSAGNWRMTPEISGGGLFHDLAPHQLDLIFYFFGEARHYAGISTCQAKDYAADDLVAGHILFNSGVVFNGNWCFTLTTEQYTDRCEIHGSAGKLSFPIFGSRITLETGTESTVFEYEPLEHVQQPMITAVTNYFLGKGDNPCGIEEAIRSMRVMDAFAEGRG